MNKLLNKIGISAERMEQLGYYLIGRVKEDARDGKFQNNTSGYSYTPKYAKLKARGMKSVKDGKNYAKYMGVSINTDVSKVNMNLTQQTLRAMRITDKKENYVEFGWLSEKHKTGEDILKILETNQLRGYDLLGLTKENEDKMTKWMADNFEIKLNNIQIKVNFTNGTIRS